ncbi:MAG TPA: SIMPL domain-containing protein [Candidatus Gastranaerophilales bacterium]|nr:SIMPL domain-containing protein [Candidatus Gastranaerophilales bacterium]
MNRKLFGVLIFCFAAFLTLPALAIQNENINIITSTATVSKEVAPDTAIFSAAVITEDKKLENAIQQNNIKAKTIYDNLKALLGPKCKIKTSTFRVNPVYKYNRALEKNELQGYKVTNEVLVETKQIGKVSVLLQKAVDSGANNINNLSFIIEDPDKYCGELLEKASIQAKQKATVIANSLGVKIIGIKSVNSSCNSPQDRPYQYGLRTMMMEKAADSSVPVEPGVLDINASVTIEFIIQN